MHFLSGVFNSLNKDGFNAGIVIHKLSFLFLRLFCTDKGSGALKPSPLYNSKQLFEHSPFPVCSPRQTLINVVSSSFCSFVHGMCLIFDVVYSS